VEAPPDLRLCGLWLMSPAGMAILSMGPGKPFYAFGFQFCYMVFLGLFHGILVLSVILSWYNPPSIGWLIKSHAAGQRQKKDVLVSA
jgi:hypothetical protein